jgi:hypothetical protein
MLWLICQFYDSFAIFNIFYFAEQGQKLANKIRAVKYMECSALTQVSDERMQIHAINLISLFSFAF